MISFANENVLTTKQAKAVYFGLQAGYQVKIFYFGFSDNEGTYTFYWTSFKLNSSIQDDFFSILKI